MNNIFSKLFSKTKKTSTRPDEKSKEKKTTFLSKLFSKTKKTSTRPDEKNKEKKSSFLSKIFSKSKKSSIHPEKDYKTRKRVSLNIIPEEISSKSKKRVISKKSSSKSKRQVISDNKSSKSNIIKIDIISNSKSNRKKSNFFVNIRYPLDHSLNKVAVEKYIDACDNKVRPLVRRIIDNTTHISFEEFIRKINMNIKDLISKLKVGRPIFIYNPFINKEKSNYWIYLYLKDFIEYKYPNIEIILLDELTRDIIDSKEDDIIVLIDDCIYSGHQMSSTIGRMKISGIKRFRIYMLVPYISIDGKNKIERQFRLNKNISNFELIFNRYMFIIKKTNDFFNDKEIEILNEYFMYNEFHNKYMIYFDHKLADSISTMTNFYSGHVLNSKNKQIIMEGSSIKKLLIIPIIKNCENNIIIDDLIPLCPATPYKKEGFEKYIKEIKNKSKSYNTK